MRGLHLRRTGAATSIPLLTFGRRLRPCQNHPLVLGPPLDRFCSKQDPRGASSATHWLDACPRQHCARPALHMARWAARQPYRRCWACPQGKEHRRNWRWWAMSQYSWQKKEKRSSRRERPKTTIARVARRGRGTAQLMSMASPALLPWARRPAGPHSLPSTAKPHRAFREDVRNPQFDREPLHQCNLKAITAARTAA